VALLFVSTVHHNNHRIIKAASSRQAVEES